MIVWLAMLGCVPRLYTEADSDSDTTEWSWTAPSNTWPIHQPAEGLVGEGWAVGDVPADFRLPDQHGDELALWQFYGDVVLVDVSTMWCAPCQDLAAGAESLYQDHVAEGFVMVTVLAEDVEGNPPDQSDLNAWGDAFGITAPIVGDGAKDVAGQTVVGNNYPALFVIDRDMTIGERIAMPTTDDGVRAAVERGLAR